MKIIFLDFDGVLNSTTDFMEARYYKNTVNSTEVISPGKLALLEEMIVHTGAKIVISSAWREMYSLKEIYDMFVVRGFTLPITTIIGKTDIVEDRGNSDYPRHRNNNIKKWLAKRDDVESFVILDDLPREDFDNDLQDNLVHTDFHNGLNYYNMQQAKNILGRIAEYQEKFDKEMQLLTALIV